MTNHVKITGSLLAILFLSATPLPALADSAKDDFSGLFKYFNDEQKRSRDGIILEQTRNRKRGTSATLSLFGREEAPLPDSFTHRNFRAREWSQEKSTNILNFRLDF